MQSTTVVERMEAETASLFFQEHVARYRFAANHIRSGRVLDIACGTGYGAEILAEIGEVEIIGVDVFRPALFQARDAYPDRRISFLAGSGTQLPFGSETFHAIVTLETIEHIADDKAFLHELARVLRADGVCVLSTPNRQYSLDRKIHNPYHVREYWPTNSRDSSTRTFAT
ncbi:MAG: class I SAM-dependent methyltransferase [Chloroflexaceae bacterium]|nr:class I SAM-dependent methyltransferase [Chloroflexaceae bacterium]